MKVLHIINDYNFSKVHKNLLSELDSYGIAQKVFIPMRRVEDIGKNEFEFKNPNSKFLYSKKIKSYHRILYFSKIRSLAQDIKNSNIFTEDIEIIHASTWFSDGGVAYLLNKEFKIPYIVTIRVTDLFVFYRYRKDLLFFAKKILKNARKIVFASTSGKNYFENLSFFNDKQTLGKIELINNGLNPFWLENIHNYKFQRKTKFKALFVGRFDNNKNVIQLINSVNLFNTLHPDLSLQLNLIGGSGALHEKCIELIKGSKSINYLGEVYDLQELKNHYRNSDLFILISKKETFGLVYIEALSQGIPIVYTKGQGIDEFFNFPVGSSTKLIDEDICKSIHEVLTNPITTINQIDFNQFNWSNISKKYIKVYYEIN